MRKKTLRRSEGDNARKEHDMRVAVELILMVLGAITLAFSIEQRRLPGGLLEWAVWILDVLIIALRLAGI